MLIKYAKDKKYIYENPLGDFVVKNQTKKKVVNVLYANEYKRIIENERNKKSCYYNLIVFLAETGLRISEVAFKESDYIITESGLHLLYVDKTLHRVLINDKETVVKLVEDVKTKESERYIPLNLFAQNAVENQLAYKKEHHIRTPFIFTSKTGTLLDKDNVGRAFRSMCKNADVPIGRGLHSLRKRYINHTLKAGVTPQDLAKTTGHSPQTMLKYYHEIDEDILRQIADTSESRTEYGDVIYVLMGKNGDVSFRKRMLENAKKHFRENFKNRIDEEKAEYILTFLSSTVLALIEHWYETGKKYSTEEFLRLTQSMITTGILGQFKLNNASNTIT